MTGLRGQVRGYLALCRAIRLKMEKYGPLLDSLAGYLDGAGLATVTTQAAVEWAMLPRASIRTGHGDLGRAAGIVDRDQGGLGHAADPAGPARAQAAERAGGVQGGQRDGEAGQGEHECPADQVSQESSGSGVLVMMGTITDTVR